MVPESTRHVDPSKSAAHPIQLPISFDWDKLNEYWELTKPRLSLLSVITAAVGYLTANPQRDATTLISLLLGTSFAAGAAGTLNQWMEREIDKRMVRTRSRPIPAGAVSPQAALLFGLTLGTLGIGILWFNVNALAALLTFVTLFSYLAAYTPLKQKTHWCTLVGAIPGAIPPLVGWSAATGAIDPLGWILFGILFFWQIPHFMAIAWTYRKDYADAGFIMSTAVDPSGKDAARQSMLHCILLLIVSIIPTFVPDMTSPFYEVMATITGVYYLVKATRFWRASNKNSPARQLFFASILYLPLILAVLVLDRWLFV